MQKTKNGKIKFCSCGDSTTNEDGICDTCKLIEDYEKQMKDKKDKE